MKKVFSKVWPFAAILMAVAIFFYPVFLQGKVPLPGDFIVGVYYPWLDYKWAGYGAGVPVKNPITTDVVSFIFPIQMFTIDLMKQGVLPLWNNLIVAGTPLIANFQSAAFSPTNFLYFILPTIFAWTAQIIAQPFLAAVFLYLLLRNFGVSRISSVAGGLFYGFAGFLMIWMQWNGHTLTAAFFPLVILFAKRWLESQKFIWGALLSLGLTLQIFSGYPQIILYEFLSLALLVIIFEREILKNFRKMFMLGLFVILGIGLATVQILPGLELLKESQRSVELVKNEWAFLPPQLLITFLAPDYFGNHSTQNYWGPADYTLTTGFSGVVVIILAGIGFLSNKKSLPLRFGLTLVLLSLAIVLPNPISVWVKESGFLGLQATSAHRALVLSNLGLAILAGIGLDSLIFKNYRKQDLIRTFYIPTILLLSFTGGTLISFFWLKSEPGGLESVVKSIANLNVGLKNLILPLAVLCLSAILIVFNDYFKKSRNIFLGLLILLGIFELFRFGWKFTPFSPKEFVFPNTPVLTFLQNQQKPFRVTAEDVVPINMMMPYRIETVEGYDAVYPLSYAEYLAALNSGQTGGDPMGRYGSVSNVNTKLFDLVNGKYVLVLKRDNNGKPDPNGNISEKFRDPKLKKVFEDKTVVVLENEAVLPRAFFVSDWETETDSQKVLQNLLADDFPLDKKIILEEEFNQFPKGKSNSKITFKDTREIEVNTDKPGLLFLSSSFYPGWKAFIDGKEAKIYRADYTFQAIPVEAGKHTVTLNYKPDSFEKGKLASLISLLFLSMIGVTQYVKKDA